MYTEQLIGGAADNQQVQHSEQARGAPEHPKYAHLRRRWLDFRRRAVDPVTGVVDRNHACFDLNQIPAFAMRHDEIRELSIERCLENTGRHLRAGKISKETRERDLQEHGNFLLEFWAHDEARLNFLLAKRDRKGGKRPPAKVATTSAGAPTAAAQAAPRVPGGAANHVAQWIRTLPYISRQNLSLALSWAAALSQ